MTDPPPARYGHYTVGRLIGRGGMALVYTARNERTGADVALKVVRGREDASSVLERFRHEAEVSGRLAHPNIVRIYDFFVTDDGTSVLVMELLRGESLAVFLARRGSLTVPEALAVGLPILAALEHTHRQGVVHRDVKVGNVFLAVEANGAAVPKLLDFGIAKRPSSSPMLTARDEVLGTPSSMSPEQIRGDAELDGRSDLFAFGGMMVELLTGTAPFHCSTASASLVAVLEREIDPPPEIPPRLFVELARALRKRPFERQPSAEALAQAIRAACADEASEGALDLAICSVTVTEGLPTLSSPPVPRTVSATVDGPLRDRHVSAPGAPPRSRAGLLAVAGGALIATIGTAALYRPSTAGHAQLGAVEPMDPAVSVTSSPDDAAVTDAPPPPPSARPREAPRAVAAPAAPRPSVTAKAAAPKPVATRPDF